MRVFCYVDDLSLLSPSFTGINEMLRTCEIYAEKNIILFNAKKSKLLHFTKSSTSKDPHLFMNDGSINVDRLICILGGSILYVNTVM